MWCLVHDVDVSLSLLFQLTSARPPRPEPKSSSKSRPSSGNSKPKLQPQLSLPAFLNGGANNSQQCAASTSSVTGSPAPSFSITSNVYVESPLARLPETSPLEDCGSSRPVTAAVQRSVSVQGGPVSSREPEAGVCRPHSQTSLTSNGGRSSTSTIG